MLSNLDFAWNSYFPTASKPLGAYKLHQVSHDSFVIVEIATESYQHPIKKEATVTGYLCKNLRDAVLATLSFRPSKVSINDKIQESKLD